VKFTKMNITGQLQEKDAARFAQRIGSSYLIAAICIGVAAIIAAIRWW